MHDSYGKKRNQLPSTVSKRLCDWSALLRLSPQFTNQSCHFYDRLGIIKLHRHQKFSFHRAFETFEIIVYSISRYQPLPFTLLRLWKLKTFLPFNIRKYIVQALVFSKLYGHLDCDFQYSRNIYSPPNLSFY